MQKYKIGNVIKVNVSGITEYGIFVKTDDGYDGLIHISEMSNKYVKNPNIFAQIGDAIYCEVLNIDEQNSHLKLSIKNIQYKKDGQRKKKIIETKHGFTTLAYKLPIWIDENLKNNKNRVNSIDK